MAHPLSPSTALRSVLTVLLTAGIAPAGAQVADRALTRTVSVTDFGARGDGSTDSTPGIQAAIEAVSRNPTGGAVMFPSGSGCYRVTAPIRLRTPGLRIEGENFANFGHGTCLAASGFAGPMFHASAPATEDWTLTNSLVGGGGRALTLSPRGQDTATYVDLQDAASARLDGLTAFTAELFFRLDANNPNYPTLWASSGSLGGTDPTHSAFAFDFDDALHLTARLHVGDTVYALRSEALVLKQVYHAALTYDGAAVRLFIGVPGTPSVLAASRAATGSLVQGPYELMPIGGRHGLWPHGGRVTDVVDGAVDSLRLSRTARYTASFRAPSNKLAFDAETLVLENFDNETIDFSIVQSPMGPTYLAKNGVLPGLLPYLEIAHLQLNVGAGIGIWLHGVILSSFHHLGMLGGVFAISGREANFLNTYSNLHLDSGVGRYAKAAIALSTNVAITSVRDSSFSSWPTAIAMTDGGGGDFTNLFIHGRQQVFPFVVHASPVHFDSVYCSNEDADEGLTASIRLVDNPNIAITGGKFERYVNSGAAIQIDGGGAVTLTAPWFQMHRDAREVIQILSPPTKKVLILNGEVTPSIPWSRSDVNLTVLP